MFKRIILVLFCCVCLADSSPLKTLQQLSQSTIDAIEQNRKKPKSAQAPFESLVKNVVSPYMDYNDMSRWVVGRQAWVKATPSEREEFTTAFRELLIRTYASSLDQYHGQTIEYFPPREPVGNKKRVQIISHITDHTGQLIKVGYRMVRHNSEWKIYDIVIEGVSLLKGFQSQFSQDIRQHGLSFATNKIRQHNKEKK